MNKYNGKLFNSFLPAISKKTCKSIIEIIKYKWKMHLQTDVNLDELVRKYNRVIREWFQYYGRFYKTALKKKPPFGGWFSLYNISV
jgi:hypothetical protein